MNIAIGSDHGGYELKQYLIGVVEQAGHVVSDHGCHSPESVDYPDFAESVCRSIINREVDAGILICGTGIGMSMAANRHREIRAGLCHDEFTARLSKEHNDANVICLGDRVTGKGVAAGIVTTWLAASFEGGRHIQRIGKFSG